MYLWCASRIVVNPQVSVVLLFHSINDPRVVRVSSSQNSIDNIRPPPLQWAWTVKKQMSHLIVEFPYQRNHRAVHFADTAELYIVEHRDDSEENKIARHELWYTKYEYSSMKNDIREDVLRARSTAFQIRPFNYSGNGDDYDTS